MTWTCMAANGTGSLVFTDDVTADRSSRMNAEKSYQVELSAQIRPRPSRNLLSAKKWYILFNGHASHITLTQLNPTCCTLPEDKTKGRKTQKPAATESSCSKDLEKHLMGGNSAFGVYGFQT